MDRWTQERLERTDNIEFAINILQERKNGLNRYSPITMKINGAIKTLRMIQTERENYLFGLAGVDIRAKGDTDGDDSDFSDCDQETKETILENAEKLEKQETLPTSPALEKAMGLEPTPWEMKI